MSKIISKVKNQNFLFSLFITIITACFWLNYNEFNISASNDDTGLFIMILTGHYDNLFINHFLSLILINLQKFTDFNVFIVFELIFNTISYFFINYVLLSINKDSKLKGLFMCVVIDLPISLYCFAFMHWTFTAMINAFAGFLILYGLNKIELKKYQKILFIVFGLATAIYGAFLRLESYLIVAGIFFVFFFCKTINHYMKNRKKGKYCDKIKKVFFNNKTIAICLLLAYAIPIVFTGISNIYKSTLDGYNDYKDYNVFRTAIVDNDYPIFNYEYYENFYSEMDFKNEYDLLMYRSWSFDDEFFTNEKLQTIIDHANPVPLFYFYNLFMSPVITGTLSQKLPFNVYYFYYICTGIVVICIIFVSIWVYKNRERYKKFRMILPWFLTFFWIVYFLSFVVNYAIGDPIDISIISIMDYTLALVLLLSVIVAFTADRYNFFILSALDIVALFFHTYLKSTRFLYRATMTYTLPIILILMFLVFDKARFRTFKHPKVSKVLVIIGVVLTLALSGFCEYVGFYKISVIEDNRAAFEYVIQHKDVAFDYNVDVHNISPTVSNLYAYDVPENLLHNGYWTHNSQLNKESVERFGIKNLYKDAIDNDKINFIYPDYVALIVKEYMQNHYAPEGKVIEAEVVKQFDNCAIYKYVTKDK